MKLRSFGQQVLSKELAPEPSYDTDDTYSQTSNKIQLLKVRAEDQPKGPKNNFVSSRIR
jgi:hypothetical protein